jgi:TPR repeat protein
MYLKGQGIKQDGSRAFHWFLAAAEQGIASAQARLGLMYATGDTTALDAIEAHKWLLIATQGGDVTAKTNCEHSEKMLTTSQLFEAKRRAQAWLEKKTRITG